MANEFTITTRLKLVNGLLRKEFNPGQFTLDQAAGIAWEQVVSVGTTEESITSFGDVANQGIAVLYNLDDTNYVQWGKATTDYIGRLKPNHLPALWNMEPGVDLYLKANTAACLVQIIVFEV